MPVWLDAIPEKAPKVARPGTGRWLLFLAFVMLAGIALTLWCWTSERTGFVFWFTALGLPFCTWGLIFGLRRFAYKAEQIGAESRNAEREALIDSEILRGQRCSWILGTYIQSPAGNKADDLLKAMKVAAPAIDFSRPRGCDKPVRYAALTEYQTDLTKALKAAVTKLTTRVEVIVQPLPPALPCWLMLDCDSDLYPLVEEQLKAELSLKTGRIFRLMAGKGLGAFDAWLDKRWDNPGILVAITLSLPASPREEDADAVSMVVFSNRKAQAWPDALRLHRPERGTEATLTKTLKRALLWARIDPDALRGSWITGPGLTAGSGWNNACEESGVEFSLSEDNFSIDPVLGYTGHASPWLAITLADAAFEQREVQVIAAQPAAAKDDIWVAVITKEEVRKESPKNV
ncbi:hypothetical protein UXP79_02725 [Enterobacter hormaechei]|uniref:hypothetical protein n=1 Tax=Enterobacter hormaechei TaxID=158836 RepID=UPI0021761A86|nr:hypothetical protein [Enterobacter hormaechei]MCU4094145.1 hypothetical protein [Enterobacter hormaechei subsp. steigerwaltii]EKS6394232.1 hypothetical protein [Enterobacter hormaechei]ELC6492073.1 hypothetical protein [Enterobacter hormaechei]ELT6674982.1 hypothetical protein [Enterobacter hormaechei]ELV3408435.1 hypothetical protein [Enterobacter hormaechei]